MKKSYFFIALILAAVILTGASCSPSAPTAPAANPNLPSYDGQQTATPPNNTVQSPAVVPPTQPAVTPPAAASAKADVNIVNFTFNPASITINAGMTVVWTNNDSVPHQIASDNNSFGSSPLSNGGTYTFTFSTPGTYTYHCAIHPSMQGTIIVK